MEHVRERSIRALHLSFAGRQQQAVGDLGGLSRRQIGDRTQIYFIQQARHALRVIVISLYEDPDRRMVVHAERFLCSKFARRRPTDLRRCTPAQLSARIADVKGADV
jgi:hypothetical protein